MDFAALMKGEIDRKRKKVETELKIDPKKKFFKRGDLARIEQEKYQQRMGIAKAPAPRDRYSFPKGNFKLIEAKDSGTRR